MRVALGLALLFAACTTSNPAFDLDDADSAGDDVSDRDPEELACTPGTPLDLVEFDFEHANCSGPLVLAGMVVTQDEGAFTMVTCEDECPCESEAPALGITLHPDIPIPVFSECIFLRAELDKEDCTPRAVTVRGEDERMLVHTESLDSPQNDAGLVVTHSLTESCDCEACDSDSLAPGTYALGFASPEDEVGPLHAGEMAEMTMFDDAGPRTYVVKALSTAIDCGCEPRRALQWSVTRG
jgi:hypothetical protein